MMNTNRYLSLMVVVAVAAMGTTGCATKKFVRNQNAPLIDRQNQLEQKNGANEKAIQDVDGRAKAGIYNAQTAADAARQDALKAQGTANSALDAANTAVHRVDSLESVIKGLDDYKQSGDIAVTFAFGKAELTKQSKDELDKFAAQIVGKRGYILEVTGSTDSVGSSEYNSRLSRLRAEAVVQYLAAKHDIPAHRFYLIGIGKEKSVAPNTTADGRKQNRRVMVQLLVNSAISGQVAVK